MIYKDVIVNPYVFVTPNSFASKRFTILYNDSVANLSPQSSLNGIYIYETTKYIRVYNIVIYKLAIIYRYK